MPVRDQQSKAISHSSGRCQRAKGNQDFQCYCQPLLSGPRPSKPLLSNLHAVSTSRLAFLDVALIVCFACCRTLLPRKYLIRHDREHSSPEHPGHDSPHPAKMQRCDPANNRCSQSTDPCGRASTHASLADPSFDKAWSRWYKNADSAGLAVVPFHGGGTIGRTDLASLFW
jgi:hypothetical protein